MLDIVNFFNKNFHDQNLYTRSWVLNGVTNLFIDYWAVRSSPGQLVCLWNMISYVKARMKGRVFETGSEASIWAQSD